MGGRYTNNWMGLDINQNLSLRGFVYITAGAASLVDPLVVALELKKWHHLAFAYDGKAVNVYIDGEVYGTVKDSGKLLENKENMAIGIRGDLSKPFNGVIDEVVVWSVARTQEEIKQDMNGAPTTVEASGKLAITWSAIKTGN